MLYKNLDASLSRSAAFVTKQLSDQCVTMLCGWVDGSSLIYTVSQKKQGTTVLSMTSPNVDRFSNFFH